MRLRMAGVIGIGVAGWWIGGLLWGQAAKLDFVQVKTRSALNRMVKVWYRVPKGVEMTRREKYRVLVIFGGRNGTGQGSANGGLGWGEWADEQQVFLVSPGFKDDNYWEPEKWSGRALFTALEQIRRKYPVCIDKLLYYGYSAGSQCSNLFPGWRPDLTRAWVSHACGVFHEPSTRMRGVPGLVTCGDADIQRYIISRNFVENSRKKGCNVIWKSFPNHPHDVPPDSLKLARAFLTYYHQLYQDDLRGASVGKATAEQTLFVGDDLENVYYPMQSAKARNIIPEDRVFLPNRQIADAWGKREL